MAQEPRGPCVRVLYCRRVRIPLQAFDPRLIIFVTNGQKTMADVLIWSERIERAGVVGLHDCTYSAVLMTLVYGGFTKFPLGMYSPAEREALESSDDRIDETGSTFFYTDQAVLRRYGLKMRQIPDGSRNGLLVKLSKPGIALAIAGSLGNLPSGHRLRKWQPSYIGPHAITVIPRGNGSVWWLDPLAPNKNPPDTATVTDVLTFAYILSDAREVADGEFDEEMIDPNRHIPAQTMYCTGGTLYADPDRKVTLLAQMKAQPVGVYARPITPIQTDGRSALAAIRVSIDKKYVGWIGDDTLKTMDTDLENRIIEKDTLFAEIINSAAKGKDI